MREVEIKGNINIIVYSEFILKFKGKYQNNEIELVCPACKEPVYLYGDKSLEVKGRFNHFPGTTCIFYDNFIEGIKGPESFNFESGQRLRSLIETKEFASKLYCFCLQMCSTGNLPINKFCDLIKLADKKKLWMAANLTEWVIGFLLLLLSDFEGRYKGEDKKNEVENTYTFRFVLIKKNKMEAKKTNIEDIWKKQSFYLKKVFASGKMMNIKNNPFPVTAEVFDEFSSNYDWILQNLGDQIIQKIKELKSSGSSR